MKTKISPAPRLTRRTGIIRRLLALTAATITAVGIMTAAGSRPASAAANEDICLTNSSGNCLWSEVLNDTVAITIYEIAQRVVIWIQKRVGQDNEGNPEQEEQDTSTGLCLADTGLRVGDPATEAPCGANGTVWIWVKDTDGYYMYSRYAFNRGKALALTVDPLSNGARVYLDISSPTNHALWQQFTYF